MHDWGWEDCDLLGRRPGLSICSFKRLCICTINTSPVYQAVRGSRAGAIGAAAALPQPRCRLRPVSSLVSWTGGVHVPNTCAPPSPTLVHHARRLIANVQGCGWPRRRARRCRAGLTTPCNVQHAHRSTELIALNLLSSPQHKARPFH